MANRYGLQIQTATPADAAGVAELMSNTGCSSNASAWATRLEAFGFESGTILLARSWGPPSGLVVLNWFRTLVADHPVAQIDTLLVATEDRRRGIGRLLLKAGAQAARSAGCGSLQLVTRETDPTLPAFAYATGFDAHGMILIRPLRKSSKQG